MDCVFKIVGSITGPIAQFLMPFFSTEIDYVVHFEDYISRLKDERDNLRDLRDDVEERVISDSNNGRRVEANVQKWLKKASELVEEVEKFLVSEARENQGWCIPGVFSKYGLGKEAKKKTDSVLGLKGDGNFTEVAYPAQLPEFGSTSSNDYEHFQSRAQLAEFGATSSKDYEHFQSRALLAEFGATSSNDYEHFQSRAQLVEFGATSSNDYEHFQSRAQLVEFGATSSNDYEHFQSTAQLAEFGATSSNAYEHFQSRAQVFQEIMEALKDDEIKMICVYGMGGVGKTRMVEEVGEQAKKDSLFDKVVITTISHNLNVRKVQGEVADGLGLKLDAETEGGRADQLRNRMMNGEKILVVIDDIWEDIELWEIGIPLIDGCKIVLTSRSQGLFQMMVQKDFEIGVLSKDEARVLFQTKVGNYVFSSPEMHSVAEDVCRECGGLPLALLEVGAVLMTESEKHVWDGILEKLRNSSLNNVEGLKDLVYSRLELSYHYLEPTDAKKCFLFCCLFPEYVQISIEDLAAYAIGLRLFENVGTIEKARNRVQKLVDNIKTSGLLLGGEKNLVKMQSVVRDVAVSIASKNELRYLVRSGIEEWPEVDTYEWYTAISLLSTYIEELPPDLVCPCLRILVLESKPLWTQVPPSFFNGMEKLEGLVLNNMSISSPETSISFLVNLRMLCLYDCIMVDISFLKELKKLENLSLQGSYIEEFRPEMIALTRLRRLNLMTNSKLGIIPTHVISSLSRLEELYISNLSADSEVELEATNKDRFNTSLFGPFSENTLFEKLTRFQVSIGEWNDVFRGNSLEHWIQVLFLKAERLHLRRVHGLNKVFDDRDKKAFNSRGLKQLGSLEIRNCESMDRIIGNEGDENDEEVAGLATFNWLRSIEFSFLPNLICFYPKMKYTSTPEQKQSIHVQPLFNEKVAIPALEKLRISGLNIKDIWDQKLPEYSFCKLKFLYVNDCQNLVCLIPFNLLQRLKNLEEIWISDCDQMTREFELLKDEEKHKTEYIKLPSLKKINLRSLPNLRQTGLNSGIVAYMNLRTLSIYKCESLGNVFSASTVRSLVHLKELSVDSCEKIEGIVTIGEEEAVKTTNHKIIFHQLEILTLKQLPTLGCFCGSGSQEVVVSASKKVFERALFSCKVAFPCLKCLFIDGLSNLTDIWHSTVPADSFCSLRRLSILRWDKLLDDSSTLPARFPTLQHCHIVEDPLSWAIACTQLPN